MKTNLRWVVTTLLLWCAGLAPAAAQGLATPPELAEARQAFELAARAYDRGELPSASANFARAHQLARSPQRLYELDGVRGRIQRDVSVLAAYATELRGAVSADARDAIEARVRVLREEMPVPPVDPSVDPARAEAASQASADPASDALTTRDSAPWVLTIAAGVALLVTGGALVAMSMLDADAIAHAPTPEDAGDARERGPVLSIAGISSIGAGVVCAIAGIVWGATASDGGSVRLGLGFGSASLTGTF